LYGGCVTIIIPAYKSADRLLNYTIPYLSKLRSLDEKKWFREVVIISEEESPKSVDKVVELCKSLNYDVLYITPSKRLGKGKAIFLGALKAKCTTLLIIDVDAPIRAEEAFLAALKSLKENVIVWCSRSTYATCLWRKALSLVFRAVMSFILKQRLDSQCGVKAFPKHIFIELYSSVREHGYFYDIFIAKEAVKKRLPVKTLYVKYRGSRAGELNNPLFALKLIPKAVKSLATIATS